MMKAIVFGANGYLGRHIAHFLKQQHVEFIPTDIAETSIDNYSNYKKIDITKIKDLSVLDFDVDYIFAFAGLTGTGNSEEIIKQFNLVNEKGLQNILDCCVGFSARVVFPSTRLVYKGIPNIPLLEDSEKEAKTIYATNKNNCEKMLQYYHQRHQLDYTIYRVCVPYGNLIDEVYSYGTIGFFMSKARKSENITIYGDGSLKRTFTHIEDLIQIILQSCLLEETKNETYNIGSNDHLSLLEVAIMVAEKYQVEVEHIEWPTEALLIESGDTIFNDEKLQAVFPYHFKHKLKNWIIES